MKTFQGFWFGALLASLCFCGFNSSYGQNPVIPDKKPIADKGLTAGDALKAAFTSYTVTGYRGYVKPGSRGIAQQSFLDLSGASKNIQIAFVLDGTGTMANDIGSLRDRLTDVVNKIRSQVTSTETKNVFVEVALVVYRDHVKSYGADNLPVWNENPVQSHGGFYAFDEDDERTQLLSLLNQTKAEGGAPYFAEQVDLGLDAALKLDWSRDNGVTKVIFIAGDAPPFDEVFINREAPQLKTSYPYWHALSQLQPDAPTLRAFRTSDLIERARSKRITIHAVSCNTSGVKEEIRRTELPKAVKFFSELSKGTGGGLLDLRDTHTVDQLVQISTGRANSLVELKNFNSTDLLAQSKREPNVNPVRVAFLPLMPLKELDYRGRFTNPAYQVVSSLARTVREIDSSLAFSGDDVRRAWTKVRGRVTPLDASLAIPELAKELGANFVVWGNLEESTAKLNVMDSTGTDIGSQSIEGVSIATSRSLWRSVSATIASTESTENDNVMRFVSLTKTIDVDAAFDRNVGSPETLPLLNQAYMKLEEAAEYPLGHSEGKTLTREAESALKQLIAMDSGNAAALMLLASCAVNLENRVELIRNLELAKNAVVDLPADNLLRLEIEGDYQLYVAQEPVAAVAKYRALLASAPELSRTALRANWLLAGLFLGDWGINPARLYSGDGLSMKECQDHARQHILAILASWSDSPEATFYKRYINPPISRKNRRPSDSSVDDTLVAEQIEYQIRVPSSRPAAMTAGLLDWNPPTESESTDLGIN
jgi:hypothetical protein